MVRTILFTAAIWVVIVGNHALAQTTDLSPLVPLELSGETPSKTPLSKVVVRALAFPGFGASQLMGKRLGAVDDSVRTRRRGEADSKLYEEISPSVVLVINESGIGSGSVIDAKGVVITNAHVVGNRTEVGVVFKPRTDGQELKRADVRRARVIKIDEIADLAVLQLSEPLPGDIRPLQLASQSSLKVGADVHAIGHPTGETWSYTKGLISQIRRNYEWQADSRGGRHKATVIQTQTPISPGNSGGPLLDDSGRIVGVNSFKDPRGENVSFAVSAEEVQRFLQSQTSRRFDRPGSEDKGSPTPEIRAKGKGRGRDEVCEPKVLKSGRAKGNQGDLAILDLDCDGKADATMYTPDRTGAIRLLIDTSKTGRPDALVTDEDRDGRWDRSYYDTDGDGKPDMVGHHPDGGIKASRIEPLSLTMDAKLAK